MSATTDAIKAKAQEEIAKIKDEAVQEYLKVKSSHPSWTVVGVIAVLALILGLVL